MSRGLPKKQANLLEKAKESALLAVDIYNRPKTSFRSGGFIVLMCIAWTSLLHAIFEKQKVKYFYRDEKFSKRFKKIDGEYKAWELLKSAKTFFELHNSVYKNIEFFYKLRNKIEHRFMPSIDAEIIGECQAFLLNFEAVLTQEFQKKHSILDNFIPLQLTYQKRNLPKIKEGEEIVSFIRQFRSSLSQDILNSQEYSFKIYLLPKLGNHRNSSDMAIEFVTFDVTNHEEMNKYEKMMVAIKEKTVPVANQGTYKPSQVLETLKTKGKEKNMAWHTRMWKKHKVRPESKSKNPKQCKVEFCQYDEPHKDYIYTDEWVKLLFKEDA